MGISSPRSFPASLPSFRTHAGWSFLLGEGEVEYLGRGHSEMPGHLTSSLAWQHDCGYFSPSTKSHFPLAQGPGPRVRLIPRSVPSPKGRRPQTHVGSYVRASAVQWHRRVEEKGQNPYEQPQKDEGSLRRKRGSCQQTHSHCTAACWGEAWESQASPGR